MFTINIVSLFLSISILQYENINGFLHHHHPSLFPTSNTVNMKGSKLLVSSSATIAGEDKVPELSEEEQQKQQWKLFTKYHALGEWRGKWTFYDYLGDIVDTTFGSVKLYPDEVEEDKIIHEHAITQESVSSDCKTCADWSNVKILPIGSYTPTTFFSTKNNLKNNRCLSVGMITGPTILRSGTMSTEMIICNPIFNKEERIRIVFQHGPVWERGVEPGSCPPDGLKLIRIMTSFEKLASSSGEQQGSSTAPIPPYLWNDKSWSGTSHTWGPTTSNRLWLINELEEIDAWHERPTGDNPNVWPLRLLGNHLIIQSPRVITGDNIELFRIAWLFPNKDDDNDDKNTDPTSKKEWNLLRIEAGIRALEMMENNEMNPDVVSFYPPRLASLRCDVLQNILIDDDA